MFGLLPFALLVSLAHCAETDNVCIVSNDSDVQGKTAVQLLHDYVHDDNGILLIAHTNQITEEATPAAGEVREVITEDCTALQNSVVKATEKHTIMVCETSKEVTDIKSGIWFLDILTHVGNVGSIYSKLVSKKQHPKKVTMILTYCPMGSVVSVLKQLQISKSGHPSSFAQYCGFTSLFALMAITALM
ncbi:glycine cleavage system aminomethyltransferase GcvT [Babesia caballi]|uniref:Glycine cleavage system aminomethyltransferase GcvT n=1 Tax=Babesia caballi TaxID=5871 RepID=A0AAV4M162_BABCB|nr:glycine cleavage system aminomethyltransferase GcvT [Babesia caballi]